MQKSALIKLVGKMQGGEEQAFSEIYKEFHDPLYYIALQLLKSDADAKDAVQETFIQIHKSICDLQSPKVFVLWMKRILLSKCNNIFRKGKKIIYDDNLVHDLSDKKILYTDETKEEVNLQSSKEVLHRLVGKLGYLQREVIVLYYFDQLKIREIASLLNVSEGTIKSRLNSGKNGLKLLMERYERESNDRLSFHSANMGALLAFSYANNTKTNFFTSLKKRAKQIFRASKVASIVGGSLVTGTVIVLATPWIISMLVSPPLTKNMIPPVISHQDAYFKLKSWAHCKDEMKLKTSAEYELVLPLFEQLKEDNGPYWEALQKYHWAQDFIEYKK